MEHIDENALADFVTLKEGKRYSQSIAQVKEVQAILLDALANRYSVRQVKALLKKHREKRSLFCGWSACFWNR